MNNYKEKLRAWNSTEKYKQECYFLEQLLRPRTNDVILDYGAGLGHATGVINCFSKCRGYDIVDYMEHPILKDFELKEIYNKAYFMHSFAHLPNPTEVLKDLKQRYNATITVITPNKDWLDPGYNNDTTVIRHYTQSELKELFVSCGYEVTLLGQFGELKNGVNERIFLQAK